MAVANLQFHSSASLLKFHPMQNASLGFMSDRHSHHLSVVSYNGDNSTSPVKRALAHNLSFVQLQRLQVKNQGFHGPVSCWRTFAQAPSTPVKLADAGGGNDDNGIGGGGGGGGGGDDDDDDDDDDDSLSGDGKKNKSDAMLALASLGKALSDLPADLAEAVRQGRIPGSIVNRFFELERHPFLRWLLQFGGMKERLLADDLFMTKVAIECGVGTITKTAAEWERRRENFAKELDFVIADVMMAIIADFMLVFLPAPTVPIRPLVSKQAGAIATFFRACPDNAFQIALPGMSYNLVQRLGAILRNGGKLFVVASAASIVGTSATNVLINVRKMFNKNYAGKSEDVPIISTSLAYGLYAAVSSNLRYQFLAGVVEQRVLEPWLHNHKLVLSAICFLVRTGNTFLGSLMWVDYARWIGVQKVQED